MCLRPISVKNPTRYVGTYVMQVPCGKCLECLKDRQNSWKLRLMEESSNWDYLYFFTLTYSDDHLPLTDSGLSTACKRDIQLWLKRFRIAFKRSYDFDFQGKYFICAEYGPNGTHRPHYHGLLMTNSDSDIVSSLFNDWSDNKGYVNVSSIGKVQGERQAVANYVSKYCCKGEFASRADDIEAGLIEKAWTLVSKGVGSSYVLKYKHYHLPDSEVACSSIEQLDTIIDRMNVSFATPKGVMTYKMPRYYKDRLYRRKFPFEVKVWNKKLKKYEDKIVWRYASKNILCCQIQERIRIRILERYLLHVGCRSWQDYLAGDFSEIERLFASKQIDDSSVRESSLRGSLFSFYQTNALRWTHL